MDSVIVVRTFKPNSLQFSETGKILYLRDAA